MNLSRLCWHLLALLCWSGAVAARSRRVNDDTTALLDLLESTDSVKSAARSASNFRSLSKAERRHDPSSRRSAYFGQLNNYRDGGFMNRRSRGEMHSRGSVPYTRRHYPSLGNGYKPSLWYRGMPMFHIGGSHVPITRRSQARDASSAHRRDSVVKKTLWSYCCSNRVVCPSSRRRRSPNFADDFKDLLTQGDNLWDELKKVGTVYSTDVCCALKMQCPTGTRPQSGR